MDIRGVKKEKVNYHDAGANLIQIVDGKKAAPCGLINEYVGIKHIHRFGGRYHGTLNCVVLARE
jgi:hypothetical protein